MMTNLCIKKCDDDDLLVLFRAPAAVRIVDTKAIAACLTVHTTVLHTNLCHLQPN